MWKKLMHIMRGEEYALRERMLRIIIIYGGLATVIAILECFLVMEINTFLIPILALLLVVMAVSFYAALKYRKYDPAAMAIGIIVIVLVFPGLFFMSGGLMGGPMVWFAFGIIYMFVMFQGVKLAVFLALTVLMYALTYGAAMCFPELIQPLPTQTAAYIDSFFSVILVGVTAGMILKAHMTVFEKEHELNLAQREQLEQSRHSQNVFFANMSHEIRSPINAIIGLNEMILRSNPSEEIAEYASDIQMAGKMLLAQVNDILDFSQMEMEKMKIIPARYHTEQMFGDLVEFIRAQREKKKLELRLDIDDKLPSVLVGDEKRIKQVILNLLDNAVKYTNEGYITLAAQGEVVGRNELILQISVADTGIGIRKEDMEHLYDIFNRADERKNARVVGSGLGLAIAKQLVDLMGGEITVDSIYTKGSVFTVKIKQIIGDRTPIGALSLKKRGGLGDSAYRPVFEAPEARVLIVDDNRMNSLVASRLLSATKVQIDVAESGAQCLEMTEKKYYHVILMDYMMPGMSGTETMKAIRKQENGLCRESAVIALTGNTLSGVREMCLEEGYDGYVEKPIQSKALEMEILQFLPSDIIEHLENDSVLVEGEGVLQRIGGRKRKKIYVTVDCACDISNEMLEKYDIKLMYLYIRTPDGRFADTREIDTDSLSEYVSSDRSDAFVESGTVEEYEEFFAEILTQAEYVIHLSLASNTGLNYKNAVTAAKGFDHVRVIDSEQVSCGLGLLTLIAAKMAQDGYSPEEICEELKKAKNRIQTRFIMPGAEIYFQRGQTREITVKACRFFQLHPLVKVNQKKMMVVGLLAGTLEQAWKQGIWWHLRRKRKISRDVVVVTHVGFSVKEQEWIRAEIQKNIPFQHVIMQKASFTSACFSGMKTVGISYLNQ